MRTTKKIFEGRIPVDYPRVMGHEIVGEVVGPVQGPMRARAFSSTRARLRSCDRCREGRGTLCANGWLIGRDRDGGLAARDGADDERFAVPDALEDAVPR